MKRILSMALVLSWFLALPPANPAGPGLCGFNAPRSQWHLITYPAFGTQQECRNAIRVELQFLRSINPPSALANDKCVQCVSTEELIK